MKRKILIVEDEEKISRFIQLELNYEGYEVEMAFDGRTGLEMAMNGDYDLLLLDIMMPGLSGMEVCRRLRQHSEVPIIMLTAKDDTLDKVMGLDTGADDYITKPFAIEELLARIRAILKRRSRPSNKDAGLTVKGVTIDPLRHTVTVKDEEVALTKKEFDLLLFMFENLNIALDRHTILEKVWGFDYFGDTNVVDVYIRYLRTKLDDKYDMKLIHTIRGVGYSVKGD